ncbi:MAG: hypothetical protein C0410_02605 [Anaerolinea sp.]|nr:hypothetical protein [Anaerolinea sp.]
MNDDIKYIGYSIKNEYKKENGVGVCVICISKDDWANLVHPAGEPTPFEFVPKELSPLTDIASQIVIAGSGVNNPRPGIDVFRLDEKDYPYIINQDHYCVIEDLNNSSYYPKFIATSENHDELEALVTNSVFIIGPTILEGQHWLKEIPDNIKNAKTNDNQKLFA